MPVQLPRIESAMIDVVSRIIIIAMPSMPSVKRMPHEGIHVMSKTACHAPCIASNDDQRPSDTMNSTTSTATAIQRGPLATPAALSSAPGARPRLRPVGVSQMRPAPITGIASSAGNTQLMYPIESRNSFIDQRIETAPTTARTPRTSTHAYVPTCPDCSAEPTQPAPRATQALPFTINPSISPTSTPRHNRFLLVAYVGRTIVLSYSSST